MRFIQRFIVLVGGVLNGLFVLLLLASAYSPYINPALHPLRSCLGLAFPIFLMADICFLVFWLLVRFYKMALLPLAGLLLCCVQIRTYIPLNFRSDRLPEECLKILSYNVMHFNAGKKTDGRNAILSYLQNSGADILCLQEFTAHPSPYLTETEIDRALHEYPYHRTDRLGDSEISSNYVACYSKYPILSAHRLSYASDCNGSVMYELKVGEDTLLLINNHLESNKLTEEDKKVYRGMLADPEKEKVKSGARLLLGKLAEASAIRAPQADSVAAVVRASAHSRIIVCGDFNDTPISYARHVIGQGLSDAFTQSGRGLGISYNQNRFYFRIDHILVSRNLQTYNCTVDRSIKDSDHYPIWCYVAPKERQDMANPNSAR